MKTNVIKYLLSVAMAAGISATTQAEDVSNSQQAITYMPELTSQNITITADSNILSQLQSGSFTRAPAPPLTNMMVLAVASSYCTEYPPQGAFYTSCDHGGTILRVAVLEIGYGNNPIAWMNGSVVSNSAMYQQTSVCITGNSYTWPCTSGQTVVGFIREYNLDGDVDGNFQYQNTSTNSPFNTMSVQIGIL